VAAAPGHVCPGIRIQVIDIARSPGTITGMSISPMPDMEAHQTIVTVALAAKSKAKTPKKARREDRSETMCVISHSSMAPRNHDAAWRLP
jgi:hypothetical protein